MAIPVARAETYYLPPPGRGRGDEWALLQPAERVWRWAEERQQRRLYPPSGYIVGRQEYARINHNRWVADCPCGSAQVVTPADPRMACTECGLGWIRLTFPEDSAAAEAAVAEELPHERNWWHPDDPHWSHREPVDDDLDSALADAAGLTTPKEVPS